MDKLGNIVFLYLDEAKLGTGERGPTGLYTSMDERNGFPPGEDELSTTVVEFLITQNIRH